MAIIPTPSTDLTVDDIHLGDPLLWARDDRDAIFARLRNEKPISFHAEFIAPPLPQGPGFWALTRHEDIVRVSRDSETFISGNGSSIADLPQELSEFLGSMINMDPPRHTKLRALVNKGFTPKMVAKIDEDVRRRAREIVDAVAPKGACDFVEEIAAPLPLQIICDMMGIPSADHRRIFELTNIILGVGDPEFGTTLDGLMAAGMELFQYAQALGEARRTQPMADLTTILMEASVDGEKLTSQEFGSFFILLVAAGNETTRNSISHGMKALTDFPDERRRWLADFDRIAPTAVEEIVRWATPVIHFRRTTSHDVEICGQTVRAGEKVVMFYNAANRDEAVFTDPYRFDVAREPNDHVGFGGGGTHFCLGANLARREIRILFEELLTRLPDVHVVGAPDRLLSGFIHGIKRMRVEFTPSGTPGSR